VKTVKLSKLWLVLIVLVMLMAALPLALAQDLPDQVMAQYPGFFPEGIEWDTANERFLLGSLAEGTVFAVDDEGTVTPLVEDVNIVSSVGIEVDEDNNRLLVAAGDSNVFFDPDAPGVAGLGIYDLDTGEQLHWVDLAALSDGTRHFANDVTVDADGNAYVTDTFSPVIYRVDPDGNAEIFLQDDRFANPATGLNGIVYHPDGYLIAAVSGSGALFKIPVDSPEDISEVTLDEPVSADGMILDDDGNLVIVGSTFEDGGPSFGVFRLSSDDEWESASIDAQMDTPRQASTAALRDGEIYIIYPGFEAMGGGTLPETSEIARVQFED
jgi:sugar lactone lactonase YvrE